MRDYDVQKADKALEMAQATLTSCAGDIRQHAADLQNWLDIQQADAIQLEDAVVAAGMPPATFYNQGRDTALPPVTSLCSLLMLFRRKMASSAISLKRQPLSVQDCPYLPPLQMAMGWRAAFPAG